MDSPGKFSPVPTITSTFCERHYCQALLIRTWGQSSPSTLLTQSPKSSKSPGKTAAASATYDYYPASYHTGYGATGGGHAHKLSQQLTPQHLPQQQPYANARSGHHGGHSGYGHGGHGGHCKGSGKGSAKADKGVMAMEMGGDMQMLILAAMAAFLASQLFNSQSRRRRRRRSDDDDDAGGVVDVAVQWLWSGTSERENKLFVLNICNHFMNFVFTVESLVLSSLRVSSS